MAIITCILGSDAAVQAQPAIDVPPPAATNRAASSLSRGRTEDAVARIRDEGLNRSQVMQTLSYLTDVIGPRLTGSPNLKHANEWTRDRLVSWGLTNAHLEPWGPFGRGWSLKRFSAQIVEPYTFPLIGAPKAWSPGFEKPLTAKVIYFDAKTEADLDKFKGKIKDAIVLTSPVREVRARFEPLATRMMDTNLLRLANAPAPRGAGRGRGGDGSTFAEGRRGLGGRRGGDAAATPTNAAATSNEPANAAASRPLQATRTLSFLAGEGAAMLVSPSSRGDGGTLFVASASVPSSEPARSGASAASTASRFSAWSANAPPIPAQITLAVEDYNRLVRMIQQGVELKMAVDLQTQFHDEDLMAYNTVAEIPGTDLKDELVMIGAHLDSWHSGTGATDNGAGVAATMEAVRILKALDLQPRRTVRIGLWTGEEQGLLGSRAYAAQRFGYYTNVTNVTVRSPGAESNESPATRSMNSTPRSTRKLVRGREYDGFSAYFNLDNGTGKIRGVYMQGNESVRPIFRQWLQPFSDLGAETLTLANAGGTDHLSFDGIGLPGFQFIQDAIEYSSRTHHSNADVFDRVQADDMKQASTVMAAFIYNAAMLDEKLPRKAIE